MMSNGSENGFDESMIGGDGSKTNRCGSTSGLGGNGLIMLIGWYWCSVWEDGNILFSRSNRMSLSIEQTSAIPLSRVSNKKLNWIHWWLVTCMVVGMMVIRTSYQKDDDNWKEGKWIGNWNFWKRVNMQGQWPGTGLGTGGGNASDDL